MKKLALLLMAICFIAGCNETNKQSKPAAPKKRRTFQGLPIEIMMEKDQKFPVELRVPVDEPIPVKVDTMDVNGIPVKVQWQDNEGQPVRVELNGGASLSVDVNIQEDGGLSVKLKRVDYNLPVELKTGSGSAFRVKLEDPVIVIGAVVAVIVVAFLAGFAAFFSWRSARNSRLTSQAVLKILEEKLKS